VKLSVLSVAYPLAPVGPDAAGGAEQILTALDHALVRNGDRSVVIACEGSRVEGSLVATPRVEGELDADARAGAHLRHRGAIERALNSRDFDLVHMHGIDFCEYLPPPGPAVLATLHLPVHWYPETVFCIERPDTWLQCVSACQERCCPPGANVVGNIGNGVPIESLQTRVRKRNFALTLARVCPEKGLHLALDAAALAGIPLLAAGEIFRYREHEQYFRQEVLPRLDSRRRFLGPVGLEPKRRLLAAARCLLVPSLAPETSSLVSMEALACGTPVIAFPSGALPEIVEHGRTGFIVNNIEEMAGAIRKADCIDSDTCRQVARERFSASRMTAEYLELYRRLARGVAARAEARTRSVTQR
jgi:glycosyltransferase involved in cell wall biosynthesis